MTEGNGEGQEIERKWMVNNKEREIESERERETQKQKNTDRLLEKRDRAYRT